MSYGAYDNYGSCCGVREIGSFMDDDMVDIDCNMSGRTAEEFLHSVFEYYKDKKGLFLHIWFPKYKKFDGSFERDYHYGDVRKLVQQIPNVIHLGKTINPNSNNRIDGYMWKVE